MTGPVERVPLTDEKLDRLEQASTQFEVFSRNEMQSLIAELRASLAREQGLHTRLMLAEEAAGAELHEAQTAADDLQQRVDKVLAEADLVEQAWLDGEHEDGPTLLACWVRAALTGTETA